jgi:hypothetical protein
MGHEAAVLLFQIDKGVNEQKRTYAAGRFLEKY